MCSLCFGAANEQVASAFNVEGYPTFFLVRKSATSDAPSAEAYEGDNKVKAMKTWITAHLAPAFDQVFISLQLYKHISSFFHAPSPYRALSLDYATKLSACCLDETYFLSSIFLSSLFLEFYLSSFSLSLVLSTYSSEQLSLY